jgi:hypothetical protein
MPALYFTKLSLNLHFSRGFRLLLSRRKVQNVSRREMTAPPHPLSVFRPVKFSSGNSTRETGIRRKQRMIKRGLARVGLAIALTVSVGVSSAQQNPDEMAQLKAQVQQLQQQLQNLSKKLDEVSAKSADAPAASNTATDAAGLSPATPPARPLIASTTPMIAPTPVTRPSNAAPRNPFPQTPADAPSSPLQIKIGDAYITPIGFVDFTGVWRDKNNGGSIGTSFAGIQYGNVYQTNLSEFRLSMQNSRFGFRVDAMVKGAHVIGYMEADFLGNLPTNVLVSSNSNTVRSRLYWVDVTKGNWEVLGGQTWSLITPGRTGISPLPANLFYSQDIDVNYQAGLVWGRIPEFRLVYHPSSTAALAIALDNPEQYVGGSAGAPVPTFPTALSALPGTQLNNQTTTTGVPNVAPDVIAKVAFDPSTHAHIEFGGLERNFRIWNPVTQTHHSAQGAGVFFNMNFEVVKGLRLLTNNFWSDGGGRYIFGQVPDLIVRSDGGLSPIHTGSSVTGFEFTHQNTLVYAYYGGIYIARNSALDANGATKIGYGFAGSSASNNRTIQEATFGMTQTLWKDPKYGALQLMFQYSYLQRNPWAIAAGQPSDANTNMVMWDLRYTLPGAPPTFK